MTKRTPVVKTISSVSTKCKNKEFIDAQILTYKKNTESAVQCILKMSKIVHLLHADFVNKVINSADVDYFCLSVNLQRNSSQFRKFVCIGKHADKFEKYITELPQTISVLYEITTLSSETFEELIENNQIKPDLTLSQLKKLASKPVNRTKSNNKTIESLVVDFDFANISESTKKIISEFYAKLKSCTDIAITLPEDDALSEYLNDINLEDEIIDVTFRAVNQPRLV